MTATSSRPRILFFLYHAGYLRHYRESIRLLAEQGAVVHLSFTRIEKDEGDTVLAERLVAEFPDRITFGESPTRGYLDGWRRTSLLVRAFMDLARYIDPRYADAPALRERMAKKIKLQILSGRSDPITTFFASRLVGRLSKRTDAKFGRRLIRLLATAERAIPTSRKVDDYVRAFAPDAVLVTPLVEYASNQVDYLKSAARLRIPTAACIASWDNLTNKGLLRFVPDRVLIWNEIQHRELVELHGIPSDRAVITGAAKFDSWFELETTRDAAEHKRHVGLDPDKPYLLYVCSSPFIAPDEVSFVKRWIAALRSAGGEVGDLGVLVRPHPQNARQWQDADLGDANAAVWPRQGAQPDFAEAKAGFYDSIAHSSAVVGVNTSAMIDAAIVGRNVLTILDEDFASTQEGTLHFHYLLRENGGFLGVARTLDEHVGQLRHVLEDGAAEEERLRGFVEHFVRPRGLDQPVAPIVAEEIAELATIAPTTSRHAGPAASALRVVLLVPSAVASLALLAGIAIEALTLGGAARRREARLERARTTQRALDQAR